MIDIGFMASFGALFAWKAASNWLIWLVPLLEVPLALAPLVLLVESLSAVLDGAWK